MMKTKSTLFLSILASCLIAKGADSKFISALSQVESNDNINALGDNRFARGKFQFHRIAWEQTSSLLRDKGQRDYHYDTYVYNGIISTIYANTYVDWLNVQLTKALGRSPLPWETYASFNLGLNGFKKRGFNFDNLPATTKKACQRIAQLTQSSIPQR
jgi:hypothetical protein